MGILFLMAISCCTYLAADDIKVLANKSEFAFALADNQELFIAITYGSWTEKLTIEFFAYDSPGVMSSLFGYSRKLLARQTLAFEADAGVVVAGDTVPEFEPVIAILRDGVATRKQWKMLCVEWVADIKGIVETIFFVHKTAPALFVDMSISLFIASAERAHSFVFLERHLSDFAASLHYLSTGS